MIDHRRLLIIVVSVSVIGVLALFLYSTTIDPKVLSIGEIDEGQLGNIVKTSGIINYARSFSDGSLSIHISNVSSQASISVYLPKNVYGSWEGGNLTPGTTIEVTGEVKLFGEELEIYVNSVEDIDIISSPQSNTHELWQVLESVEVLDGMNLTTSGKIYDMETIESSGDVIGTVFEISNKCDNKTYSLECIIFAQDISGDFEDGDVATVTGELGFYKYSGSWQIVVTQIVHE